MIGSAQLRPAQAVACLERCVGVRLPRRLTKFVLVGGSGVIVNSIALYLLHERLGLPLLLASALAVEIAIINNYLWNDRWTFERHMPSLERFGRFNVVSLGGLVITSFSVWLLTAQLGMYYLVANFAGIALAMSWNFAANLYWTWGQRRAIAQT